MLRTIFLLPLILFFGQMKATEAAYMPEEPAVQIKFELKGLPAGTCRIIGMMGSQNYLVDSLQSTAGKAYFEKEEALPGGLYYFVFPDGRTFVSFLLDNDQAFTIEGDTKDIIGTAKIKGCLDNELFFKNQRFEKDFRVRFDSVDKALKNLQPGDMNQAYLQNQKDKLIEDRKSHVQSFVNDHPESFFTIFKLAGQNPELEFPKRPDGTIDTVRQVFLYRQAYWNNTDLADERLLRTPVVMNKLKTYITQITAQNSDSIAKSADRVISMAQPCKECFKFVVNWIAIEYEKPKFMGGDAILVHLVDKWFTDELAFWYKESPKELKKIRKKVNERRPSLLGKTGQDLRCKDIEGNYVNLYEMKEPIRVLYMYSYSCEHCRKRSPILAEVFADWKDKGLDVFALCLDPELEKWKKFVERYGMQGFHNVNDPDLESRYYKKYHVDVTPELYVFDENWKIIAKDLHPNQLRELLERELGDE